RQVHEGRLVAALHRRHHPPVRPGGGLGSGRRPPRARHRDRRRRQASAASYETGVTSAPSDRSIVIDSLGVGLATGAYGLSFGALGVAAGLTVWQTCVMSLLMFTGASQFAFLGVVASG